MTGKLIILSGPSGAGKSTVVKRMLEAEPRFCLSVSATTRAPRDGETDGVDYHFLTHTEFKRRREAGEFLECKEVFGRGDWYGTLRSEVASGLSQGKWVVLEIDVEGAFSVLEQMPEALTIFLHPGSLEELERRLRNRGTDTEEAIQRRLEVARAEMSKGARYRHEVINDTPDAAVERIRQIVQAS